VVASGRLVVSDYGDPPTAPFAESIVTRLGFAVAGRTRQPIRSGRPRGFASVWIDAGLP
jgi:hypothetical protein